MTTQHRLRAAVGSVALMAIVFYATAIVVTEGQAVLITRFGRPLRAATQPGLHWKLPWPIDQASILDMRRRVYETGHTEMLTRDKKNIIARTFVVWRIGDPLTFTQAIGFQGSAETKLDGLLTNAAIGTLGGHDLSALVSTNPADLHVDQIEHELLASTATTASRSYGVA
ncbi:MAG TPA: SPFH domain-containing protein, partial [Vicinamibacterales bacterium]|nr:SPFH domain-containing protein [Vicinamibacterales bacterium]